MMSTRRETMVVTMGLIGGLAMSAGMTACVDSNHRMTIGEGVRPMAFQEAQGTMHENDGPSLATVGRSEWATVEYAVPADGVGHRPNYRTHWLTDKTNARKRGEFPTATTAFDLGKTGEMSQTQEVLLAPFNQLFDVIVMPVMLFVEPQTMEMRSPYAHYERTPKGSVMPVASSCCEPGCAGACDGACEDEGVTTDHGAADKAAEGGR